MEVSIIGGDLRIVRLVEEYVKENVKTYVYGLDKYFANMEIDNNIIICKNIEDVISASKYIISSIPLSRDNIYINSPFTDNKIKLEDFTEKLLNYSVYLENKNREKINFISGKIPKVLYNGIINNIDLLKNEEFNILNSIPTVEGSIKIIIEEREETIHESNILVCGFGRIGKILCNRLKALGANIYCSARKDSDLAWIREEGYIPLKYGEIEKYGGIFDVLINTVPTLVIDKEKIDSFRQDILLIELASNPGGIDREHAILKKLNIKIALGIPGKEMPKAAGRYIKEITNKLIKS